MKHIYNGQRPEFEERLQLEEIAEEIEWYNINVNSVKPQDKAKLLKKKAVIINGIK